VLFPDSYAHTSQWLRTIVEPGELVLVAAQQQLLAALDAHPRFKQLATGCEVSARLEVIKRGGGNGSGKHTHG
jgi:hypothetical protein